MTDRLKTRIETLETQRQTLLRYQQDRATEGDHHGVWDSAIDLARVDAELKGLRFVLGCQHEVRP